MVLLEYLSQGVPFLAYKVGEVSNVLIEHLPLFFIDNYDLTEWGHRIQEIKRSNISDVKLKEIFYKYFGPEQYINQCMQIYQKVLNS